MGEKERKDVIGEEMKARQFNKVVEKEITTPTGNVLSIRRMKVKDEDIITNRELARDGKNIIEFVKSITGISQEKYDRLLQGEIFYILIQIRIFSKGSEYEAKVKSPYSGRLINININLSELHSQRLNKRKVNNNYEYEITLPYLKIR